MDRGGIFIVSSAIAHGWTWAVLIFLVFWPSFYQGVSATAEVASSSSAITRHLQQDAFPQGTQVQRRTSASLIEVNGFSVLPLLFVPVFLTGLGLIAALIIDTRRMLSRAILWGSAALLFVFSLLGMFSIGLLYLPAALAMIVSVVAGSGHHSVKAKPGTL